MDPNALIPRGDPSLRWGKIFDIGGGGGDHYYLWCANVDEGGAPCNRYLEASCALELEAMFLCLVDGDITGGACGVCGKPVDYKRVRHLPIPIAEFVKRNPGISPGGTPKPYPRAVSERMKALAPGRAVDLCPALALDPNIDPVGDSSDEFLAMMLAVCEDPETGQLLLSGAEEAGRDQVFQILEDAQAIMAGASERQSKINKLFSFAAAAKEWLPKIKNAIQAA